MSQDLLLEIGVEELPASFVRSALDALPELTKNRLAELRLPHGEIWVSGTPRRLAVKVDDLAEGQPDLDEMVTGPSARAAFDAQGNPTKAAQSFAAKLGCPVEALQRMNTPKGEYVAGRRSEKGRTTLELLPAALGRIIAAIPFRKSMRWATVEVAFGRPLRWLVALYGNTVVPFRYAELDSGRTTYGHRFLAPEPLIIQDPAQYRELLARHHVMVDIEERKTVMLERLLEAARSIGGALIRDDFLMEENCTLVEDPRVVVGGFEPAYLDLPEQVILNVARGHQRYFGVRDAQGRLLPNYLAVVGTAVRPENVRRGNDRVMRARLADAKFFYDTDLSTPLLQRREKLDGIVFHKSLGSVGEKVRRMEGLVAQLGQELQMPSEEQSLALQGAALAKCDLTTLMVGEFPELQGEIGAVYAGVQGVDAKVACTIVEHYQPKGADDSTAASVAGALVGLADRLDTLVGCFAIGQAPTGTADPLALRRATLGILRTLLDKAWDLNLACAIGHAYRGYSGVKLEQSLEATTSALVAFFRDRLRGLLPYPHDVVDACLALAAERPLDARRRVEVLAAMNSDLLATVAEVFKRAANIAREAPEGTAVQPSRIEPQPHPAEVELFDALGQLRGGLTSLVEKGLYAEALQSIAEFAPVLARFFSEVFVMVEDRALRDNRLRLLRDVYLTCSQVANFDLLMNRKAV